MSLFQTSVLKNYIKLQDTKAIDIAFKKYADYFHNFAIQTRKQELADQEFDFNKKTEEEKRLFLRQEMI